MVGKSRDDGTCSLVGVTCSQCVGNEGDTLVAGIVTSHLVWPHSFFDCEAEHLDCESCDTATEATAAAATAAAAVVVVAVTAAVRSYTGLLSQCSEDALQCIEVTSYEGLTS